ncbi:hypothetical protein CLCR_10992 [Cladophialophora carrionii]|uniref:Uncharacterized protein n=1 Tax=Cladophialophora carrionii TaxID=86049 RepID=A0A1C1CXP8_9EURO|nr:hypothetical protein CLCR_10992 [Cladophialophora carrionii]
MASSTCMYQEGNKERTQFSCRIMASRIGAASTRGCLGIAAKQSSRLSSSRDSLTSRAGLIFRFVSTRPAGLARSANKPFTTSRGVVFFRSKRSSQDLPSPVRGVAGMVYPEQGFREGGLADDTVG